MELDQLDGLLTALRSNGVVKFEGFGVSLLMGPQAQRAIAAKVEQPPAPVPAAPIPTTPTVADIEKLEAELFEGPQS
jgi:hypothetical protein